MTALVFHHFGIACRNLDRETTEYQKLGYSIERDDFEDPIQGVHGRFLTGHNLPRLELLVALAGSEVLEPWLGSGTRIYHQAFESDSFDAQLETMVNDGGRVVVPPVPAIAFDDRRIAFVMKRNLALIELIDSVEH